MRNAVTSRQETPLSRTGNFRADSETYSRVENETATEIFTGKSRHVSSPQRQTGRCNAVTSQQAAITRVARARPGPKTISTHPSYVTSPRPQLDSDGWPT